MKPKTVYLILCAAGFVFPYSQFLPWVVEHGLNMRLFVEQLFANRISAFFGMDVLVSAIVVVAFARVEARRVRIRPRWLPVAALLCVGVSLALPLLLYLREVELEKRAA